MTIKNNALYVLQIMKTFANIKLRDCFNRHDSYFKNNKRIHVYTKILIGIIKCENITHKTIRTLYTAFNIYLQFQHSHASSGFLSGIMFKAQLGQTNKYAMFILLRCSLDYG